MAGRISLIVHGGAGQIPESERQAHRIGLDAALEAGWRLLARGAPAMDAVEAAVRLLENDPAFNAGIGSVLRLDGSVSLDASIMEGKGRRAGAVAGVSRVPHPVTLARYVLESTPHVFMIGQGAELLASRAGMELCEPARFVTVAERERLEKLLAAAPAARGLERQLHGTVGAAARDREGSLAAATSTGGAFGCLPGRVGDSPIIGAGTFADDRRGAVCSTGVGENILRTLLAREIAGLMEAGREAAEAARLGVELLEAETGGRCGAICVDPHGGLGASYSTPWMGTASRSAP
jgi:beta-aspartyl-peptidase (threonine type)